MRRWPWLVAALALALVAFLAFPRADTYTAQNEGSGGVSGSTKAPFPLATLLLALSAGVCLAAGFRPQSRAVQRALGQDDPDPARGGVHQRSFDVLERLRQR